MKTRQEILKIKAKKIIIVVLAMIMIFSTFGCTKGENKTDKAYDEALIILTSYIDVEDAKYNGCDMTTFTFVDRESAEDFAYYWLDRGYTVGGVIEHTNTGYFTVDVIEKEFDDICRETVMALGGYEVAIQARRGSGN